MTITAKFASRCAACGHPIATGAKIEWAKGSPARHTSCATSTFTTPLSVVTSSATRTLRNGDIYTAKNGQKKTFGCSACTRGDRMCRDCQFDEYDS